MKKSIFFIFIYEKIRVILYNIISGDLDGI